MLANNTMEMCQRCHKRMAVVFVTRMENGTTKNEGLCMKCAKELGIKPISDYIEKLGITDEDLDAMDQDMNHFLSEIENISPDGEENDGEDAKGKAPAIDLQRIFGSSGASIPDNASGISGEKMKTTSKSKETKRKYLSSYCIDLTGRAREEKLDRVIGREAELARMMQILCRRQKNNPCLIGEPGVGKTALAEALAQRIVKGDVPFKLKNKEIYLLDLTALIAGTQFRGQFESRIKGLVDEIKSLGNIILVIDEVHNIASAGDADGSMNAANILKPVLSRGELQVIGATTLKEYRKYIEKDSALERRFQPIIIKEPNVEETIEVMEGIKSHYEKYHGIQIPSDTVRQIVYLADRYLTDRFFPDKAIDLIDEASAHLVLNSPVINRIDEIAAQMDSLKKEQEQLERNSDGNDEKANEKTYERLAEIKVQNLQLSNELRALSVERDKIKLTPADVASVIEVWTGIPASNVSENEFLRLEGLEDRLKKRIVGQDQAISAVVRSIKRNRAGVSYKRKPISFIFAGPTGVGKTELVKTLAQDLFHSPEALIRLDMSEFMEKHSVSRIIGAPPGYVGYDEAGQLTEKIRRKPYSVVLFDEIEKAHPDVLNIMLQILDDGHITDAQGRYVNFENTIVIMTTNAGSANHSNTAGFGVSEQSIAENNTEKALLGFLRPEFINRVDEVITFRSLNEKDFVQIARIMISDLRANLERKNIQLHVSDAAIDWIAEKSFSRKYGARNMRRYLQKEVEDQIAELIISNYEHVPSGFSVDVSKDQKKMEIQILK